MMGRAVAYSLINLNSHHHSHSKYTPSKNYLAHYFVRETPGFLHAQYLGKNSVTLNPLLCGSQVLMQLVPYLPRLFSECCYGHAHACAARGQVISHGVYV